MTDVLASTLIDDFPVGAVGSPLREKPLDAFPGASGALVVARLTGSAISLGAFQRAQSAVDIETAIDRGLSLTRRATGGPSLRVGRGQIYIALELANAAVFGAHVDVSRALNRHVRPLLAALQQHARAAAYTGRDFLSDGPNTVAWVGLRHERATERVGLEAIVACSTPFAIEPDLDLAHGAIAPRFRGKIASSLGVQSDTNERLLARKIYDAYASRASEVVAFDAGITARISAIADHESLATEKPFDALVEDAIGLVGAVVEDDEYARIGGDFMASHDVVDALCVRLSELSPFATNTRTAHENAAHENAIERAIDEAFGASSNGAYLFGVAHLSSLAKAVRGARAVRATRATKTHTRG